MLELPQAVRRECFLCNINSVVYIWNSMFTFNYISSKSIFKPKQIYFRIPADLK